MYMAPELFGDGEHGFAIVMYQILSPVSAFADISEQLSEKVKQGVRPPILPEIPEPFVRLIEKCWAADRTARPGFEAIVAMLSSDEFLMAGLDLEQVREYRARVFPSPSARSRASHAAELAKLEAEYGDSARALLQEITDLQNEHCRVCA
jgi:hypothetical protein